MNKPPTPLPAHPSQLASVSRLQPRRPTAWVSHGPSRAPLPTGDVGPATLLWQHAVHDVRGKLGVVSNITNLLRQSPSEPQRAALLAMLERNVAGMGQLLDSVADLARLDAAPPAPAFERVNAAAVLKGVCDSLAAMSDSRGLQIEFRGPHLLVAETDALMLERIVQNLMLNAIRYTRCRSVVLACGDSGHAAMGHWFFDIRDASPVHAVDSPEAVLETPPASSGARPLPAGDGIGLAIVARLTASLGGDVESAPTAVGRWTRVTLPKHFGVSRVTPQRAASAGACCPAQATHTDGPSPSSSLAK